MMVNDMRDYRSLLFVLGGERKCKGNRRISARERLLKRALSDVAVREYPIFSP